MEKKKHNRDIVRALGMVTQIGITMLVPIVLCFFFGRWLDGRFDTGCFMIIFTILGVMAAYRNLFAITKPLLKGEREREDEAYRRAHQRKSEGMDQSEQQNSD